MDMTERVDIKLKASLELRTKFKAATAENGHSMQWVLEKFMERYVAEEEAKKQKK